jgi:PII-like signaling protein
MSEAGPAKRLIVTVSEDDRWHGRRAHDALLALFLHRGFVGATVARAIAGHMARGGVHTADIVDLSGPLPIRVEVVAAADAIDRVLPDVYDIVEHGLVEVQDTQIVKWWPDVALRQPSSREALVRLIGKAKQLQIHIGERDTWEGEPLHAAIVKRARQLGIAGATVYRGTSGYGAHRTLHRHKRLSLSSDDPILVSVIDSPDHIDQLLAALDSMVSGGCLITISDVTVVKYAPHGEESAGVPVERPSEDSLS